MDILPLVNGVVFLVGIFYSAYSRLREKITSKKFLLTLTYGALLYLIFFIKDLPKTPDRLDQIFFTFGLLWCIAIYLSFKRELLPNLNEEVIFINTLAFWYILIKIYGLIIFNNFFILLGIIPTVICTINVFSKKVLNLPTKIIAYLWYLIVLIVILNIQLPFIDLISFLENGLPSPVIYENLVLGVFIMFLINNLAPIIEFIPSSDERDYLGRLKSHVSILKSRYSDQQTTIKRAGLIFVIVFFVFLLNSSYNFIGDILLTSIIVVVVPETIDYIERSKVIKD